VKHEKFGIKISGVTAAGGIANKTPLLMQIYADVLGRDINIAKSTQSGALGSAVCAAAAAGAYPSIEAASKAFAPKSDKVYHPIESNVKNIMKYMQNTVRFTTILLKTRFSF
jgi:L-ribulokinase